jgi:hypothetical protein
MIAPLLKLTALDAEDLEVISAHLQDAVLLAGDIRYLKKEGKLALAANRFVWDGDARSHERRRSGLQFNRITAVRTQRIILADAQGVLNLLCIGFAETNPPSGIITLNFSGGGVIRLDAECIEARLEDLGPAWHTAHRPSHER